MHLESGFHLELNRVVENSGLLAYKELPITTTYPSLESLHAVDNPKPDVAYTKKW